MTCRACFPGAKEWFRGEADTALDTFPGKGPHHGVLRGAGDGIDAAETDERPGSQIKVPGGDEGPKIGQGGQGETEG